MIEQKLYSNKALNYYSRVNRYLLPNCVKRIKKLLVLFTNSKSARVTRSGVPQIARLTNTTREQINPTPRKTSIPPPRNNNLNSHHHRPQNPPHTTTTMFAQTFRSAAPRMSTRAFSTTPRAALARMSIVGRLGTAPEEVTVSGDRTLVRYVLGSSYGKGDDSKTSWFRVASFAQGPQKDFLMSLPKGSLLYVEADARMDSFTDAEGNKRSNLSLIASE
jgi:hypothetical protein